MSQKNSKRSDRTTVEAIRHFFTSLYQIGQIAYTAAPRLFVATIILRIIQSLMPVATAFAVALIFDQLGIVLTSQETVVFEETILPLVLFFGFLLIVSQLLTTIDLYFNEDMGRRVSLRVSQLSYGQLLNLPGLQYFESPKFHDTLRQATEGIQWEPGNILRQATGALGSIITLLGFLGVVLVFNPLLALILLVATVPTLITQMRFRRKRFDMSWHNSPKERKAWYYGHLLSNTHYAKELRLFNLGHYLLRRYTTTMEDVHRLQRDLNQEELRLNSAVNLLGAIITVGTYILVISQAFARTITLGDVTLYIEAVRNVQTNLNNLAYNIVSLSERTLFFTHYQDLMALETTLPMLEPKHDLTPLREKLELRGVSFRYTEDSDWVLKDINLTIAKGESLALVGVNGAGKTTLVKLLARFYDPTEGQILWDGVDIRHYDPVDLRERIGAVFQDFVQYEVTARENIGFGDVTHINDSERIQKVAQNIGVSQFIEDLPQQYETVLSRWLLQDQEDGTDLSGGQWQKIAIARTYLRNADVLMLDEPTAALDAEAEHDIYERFATLTQNRASILISHRFSTVRMADKIAVIEDGIISELGSHHDLIAHNGTYAHLYGLQAEKYTG